MASRAAAGLPEIANHEYRDDPTKLVVNATAKLSYSREKAKRLIGWEPQVPVEEGIRRLIEWNERNASTAT